MWSTKYVYDYVQKLPLIFCKLSVKLQGDISLLGYLDQTDSMV